MTEADDPIAFELFRNAIFSIADETALTIFRMTCSGVLKDKMDYSTVLCDAGGKLVAQDLTLPRRLGAIPTAPEVVVACCHDDMAPGDVLAMTDPLEGGMHLPDIFVLKPPLLRRRAERFCRDDPPSQRSRRSGRRLELATPRRGGCIIEEYDATGVIPPGATASLDAIGSILIEL